MTALHSANTPDAVRAAAEVDIAGSPWPVYKLEALAVGLVIALLAVLVIGTAQAGVLAGAGAGVALWMLGRWRAPR